MDAKCLFFPQKKDESFQKKEYTRLLIKYVHQFNYHENHELLSIFAFMKACRGQIVFYEEGGGGRGRFRGIQFSKGLNFEVSIKKMHKM